MRVSKNLQVAAQIVSGLHAAAKPETKQWLTNYVKGTKWIGNKVPSIRMVVRETVRNHGKTSKFELSDLLDNSVHLLMQEECDVKLAGMILLSESCPIEEMSTMHVLDRLTEQVLQPEIYITDWSTADWFAMRILRRIAYANDSDGNVNADYELTMKIVNFAKDGTTLWYRRCGIVPFVDYYKNRDKLPPNFGKIIVDAVEHCLIASPGERFTQTGCAWVLRYALTQEDDTEYALEMITKHAKTWNTEAKKSMTEKLPTKDPVRKRIMSFVAT